MMLTRTWRIVLLLAALVFTLWPAWLPDPWAYWLVLIAVVVLLVGELAAPAKGKK